jgi:endonuclease/exonuclease/phosphatase (EEP) superfamily protein YafD
VVITRLDWDGEELTVVAVHGPHLSHGAHRTYRAIRRLCDELTGEVIIAGDFNSWRPPLRVFLPGWRSLARRRTWPMRLPHSQIDHVLTRSARLRTLAARAVATGSDHRALVVDLAR